MAREIIEFSRFKGRTVGNIGWKAVNQQRWAEGLGSHPIVFEERSRFNFDPSQLTSTLKFLGRNISARIANDPLPYSAAMVLIGLGLVAKFGPGIIGTSSQLHSPSEGGNISYFYPSRSSNQGKDSLEEAQRQVILDQIMQIQRADNLLKGEGAYPIERKIYQKAIELGYRFGNFVTDLPAKKIQLNESIPVVRLPVNDASLPEDNFLGMQKPGVVQLSGGINVVSPTGERVFYVLLSVGSYLQPGIPKSKDLLTQGNSLQWVKVSAPSFPTTGTGGLR